MTPRVRRSEIDTGLVGIFTFLRHRLSDGVGSAVALGNTTASGYPCRMLRTSGSADSRIEKMCSGPARKSSIALFWIATVEYSRHRRCLMVAFRWLAIRPEML